MTQLTRRLIIMLIMTVCLSTRAIAGPPPVYVMGVVPQFEPRRIVEIWQPIIDQVNHRAHVKIVLKSSPSIPEFERQFGEGKFDFAYMNPYDLLVANEKQGYQPILRDVGRKLFGIIVVKKDSLLKSVVELDGKKVAFPAPNALGAALIPRAEFSRKYHIKVEESYVKSHSSVYLNVVLGLTDAGGGVMRTLSQQPKEIQDRLRILYKTQEVSPHPIAIHPRVPGDVRARVIAAFLDMGSNAEGQRELARIPIKKIGKATLKDYETLRKMGISKFYVE
jgi:phosphonate transport system substrate-binding protein